MRCVKFIACSLALCLGVRVFGQNEFAERHVNDSLMGFQLPADEFFVSLLLGKDIDDPSLAKLQKEHVEQEAAYTNAIALPMSEVERLRDLLGPLAYREERLKAGAWRREQVRQLRSKLPGKIIEILGEQKVEEYRKEWLMEQLRSHGSRLFERESAWQDLGLVTDISPEQVKEANQNVMVDVVASLRASILSKQNALFTKEYEGTSLKARFDQYIESFEVQR